MARKAGPKTGAGAAAGRGGSKGEGASAKGGAGKSARPATARKKPGQTGAKLRRETGRGKRQSQHGAADAVIKLLESPLVVDLIAVGATAALAAIAEQRFGRRSAHDETSGSTAKAVGKAAAAAMGRRIAVEVDEILKASKKPTNGK